ncbi:Hypothetical predicted protein [Pelobates cultripes]|uniref:Uncharacterized protein n=1 Tax=Pelobates cultripes TaxID=61616 RepID=A0AAD1SJL5_PELCU|nr:Hypothetical predicted protein [Pelobates cultripes]
MAAPEADLQRLLQSYLEVHGQGALDELVSDVRIIGPADGGISGQPAVPGERRARRSRSPLRLSPSPVRQSERRRSGGPVVHPERPSVSGRRRTRAGEVRGVQAQDGGGSNGAGMAGRSLPVQLEVSSSGTPCGMRMSEVNVIQQGEYVTASHRRVRPSQALHSTVVAPVVEPAGGRRMSSSGVRLGLDAGCGSPP